jgi:hypothetical protein
VKALAGVVAALGLFAVSAIAWLYEAWALRTIWGWHLTGYLRSPTIREAFAVAVVIALLRARPVTDEERKALGITPFWWPFFVATFCLIIAWVARAF